MGPYRLKRAKLEAAGAPVELLIGRWKTLPHAHATCDRDDTPTSVRTSSIEIHLDSTLPISHLELCKITKVQPFVQSSTDSI